MVSKEEMIDRLIEAARRRDAEDDDLHLGAWARENWKTLLERATLVDLGPGEVLLKKNAPAHALYFLIEGVLEVSTPRPDSISFSPVALVQPGSVVGEVSFLDHRPRTASVWARDRATLFRLSFQDFELFRRDHPEMAAELLMAIGQILATRLRNLMGPGTGSGGPAYG